MIYEFHKLGWEVVLQMMVSLFGASPIKYCHYLNCVSVISSSVTSWAEMPKVLIPSDQILNIFALWTFEAVTLWLYVLLNEQYLISLYYKQKERRNKHLESRKVLLWSHLSTGGELITFSFILTPVDQPDCSSDPELTSGFDIFCSVMLTADWSWRGNGHYFMNVMLDREPEPASLQSAEVDPI